MGRRFVQCSLVCAAMGMAFAPQPAMAGERKTEALQGHHLGASIHTKGENERAGAGRLDGRAVRVAVTKTGVEGIKVADRTRVVGVGNTGHSEISFVPVTPLNSEARDQKSEVRHDDRGPNTAPSERKHITFFRLDPKLGDVSVQPVVGGVNGAQLSVGF